MAHETYAPTTMWKFGIKGTGGEKIEPLHLGWSVEGDAISDNYSPGEISAAELYTIWQKQSIKDGRAGISWFVGGELAPFQEAYHRETFGKDPDPILGTVLPHEDFLTYFMWPVDAATGDPLNWLRLPIEDKLWNTDRADKGGFIQELTGWKPSPFERVFRADIIGRASRLAH